GGGGRGIYGKKPGGAVSEARVPPQIPAEAGNKSCCAQPRAARIAGLRTAPPPARSSRASQHSGDGGLPGKKIALDLQLPDLPVQIVDHLLRILRRWRLAAACKQLPRTLHQLLLPVADHRRMNPKLRRQLRQGLLPRKRRHRHPRFEFRAVLLSLYTHFSRPFWTGQSLAYPVVQKSGAAAKLASYGAAKKGGHARHRASPAQGTEPPS